MGKTIRAKELLAAGRYLEAAQIFDAEGESAAAARAFLSAKVYRRAAECYEKAGKPVDAARIYLQLRDWGKAATLFAQSGDMQQAESALAKLRQEQDAADRQEDPDPSPAPTPAPAAPSVPVPAPVPALQPKPPETGWPGGAIWQAMRAGDSATAVRSYLQGGRSGWELIAEARSPEAMRALAKTLFQARDHAVAAEAFLKAGDVVRAAECLSLAGLNEDAAHYFIKLGEKTLAAQHLEKAHAWDEAAELYLQEHSFLDAARCHEKGDNPVRAAAMYLKAKKPDFALPLLQTIPPSHRSFAACKLLAGKIFFQKGRKDLAVSSLAPLLETLSPTEEGLDAFYQAAVLLELGGVADRAAEAFQRIQETRYGYRDVGDRLRTLSHPGRPAPPSERAAAPPPDEAHLPATADFSSLRDCYLFNRLNHDELRRIWMIGRSGECKPGKVILKAGEVSRNLMVVLAGGVAANPGPAGTATEPKIIGPGGHAGLEGLISAPPPAETLVAQRGTRLLAIPLDALESLLSTETDMGLRFFRSVAEHLVRQPKSAPPR